MDWLPVVSVMILAVTVVVLGVALVHSRLKVAQLGHALKEARRHASGDNMARKNTRRTMWGD